jgi:hypothetical protein
MIHRLIRKNIRYITAFHTQEWRPVGLDSPIEGKPEEAWLGVGYYFWVEIEFAHFWGQDRKKSRTGFYDIYKAEIEETDLLNASFDEKTYFRFRQMIEDTISHFNAKRRQISLLKVNRFLADNFWGKHNVKGIIYDDLPQNNPSKGRFYSEIPPLYYKKRIQIVVFDKEIINNFAIEKESVC